MRVTAVGPKVESPKPTEAPSSPAPAGGSSSPESNGSTHVVAEDRSEGLNVGNSGNSSETNSSDTTESGSTTGGTIAEDNAGNSGGLYSYGGAGNYTTGGNSTSGGYSGGGSTAGNYSAGGGYNMAGYGNNTGANPAAVVQGDPNTVFSQAYYENLAQNGDITAYSLDFNNDFDAPEVLNSQLQYAREFLVDPSVRGNSFRRLATQESGAGQIAQASQVLSQVQIDLNRPGDYFAAVAANWKLDNNYDNGALRNLIDSRVPPEVLAQYDLAGVGDTDVETLGAIAHFLNSPADGGPQYFTIQDVLASGGIPGYEAGSNNEVTRAYDAMVQNVGQNFANDVGNLQRGNFDAVQGPLRIDVNQGNEGGGGGGNAPDNNTGAMKRYNPLMTSMMGQMMLPLLMQLLMLLLQLYTQVTGEEFPGMEQIQQLLGGATGGQLGGQLGGPLAGGVGGFGQTGFLGAGGLTGASPFQLGGSPSLLGGGAALGGNALLGGTNFMGVGGQQLALGGFLPSFV